MLAMLSPTGQRGKLVAVFNKKIKIYLFVSNVFFYTFDTSKEKTYANYYFYINQLILTQG